MTMTAAAVQHEIVISPAGEVSFVYDDDLVMLEELGVMSIRRASHVEPAEGGGWTADMGPTGGPVLGPFPMRAEALAAEHAWLTGVMAGSGGPSS